MPPQLETWGGESPPCPPLPTPMLMGEYRICSSSWGSCAPQNVSLYFIINFCAIAKDSPKVQSLVVKYLLLHSQSLRSSCYSRWQIKESTKVGHSYYVTRGSGGMPPKIFWCFHALRKLLVQSEANSYSTAIENHDIMLWLTCCMKLKCIVGYQNRPLCHYLDLPLLFWCFCICLMHWN